MLWSRTSVKNFWLPTNQQKHGHDTWQGVPFLFHWKKGALLITSGTKRTERWTKVRIPPNSHCWQVEVEATPRIVMNDICAAIRHKVYPLGFCCGSVTNFVGHLGDGQAAYKMGALIVKSWTGWKCQDNTFGANEFFFVLLSHPSFSPDLARSDFYLCFELKFNFFGHRY